MLIVCTARGHGGGGTGSDEWNYVTEPVRTAHRLLTPPYRRIDSHWSIHRDVQAFTERSNCYHVLRVILVIRY